MTDNLTEQFEPFLGSWRLISAQRKLKDSEEVVDWPEWTNGEGSLLYTGNGCFSAQVMRPGRPKFGTQDRDQWTSEEITPDFKGYVAYYGFYHFDRDAGNSNTGFVYHHVSGALIPDWIGGTEKREFEFSEDNKKLILTTQPFPMDDAEYKGIFGWERIEEVTPFSAVQALESFVLWPLLKK